MAAKKKISAKSKKSAAKEPYEVGQAYFIRGVTNYYTGRLVQVTPTDLVLAEAAWIADTGRFGAALKSGEFNEVEPYPGAVIIPRGSIADASPWAHALPREAK